MALPPNNQAWPPAQLASMRAKWAEWGFWYSNDITGLTDVYTGGQQSTSRDGVLKSAARAAVRFFWGEKRTDLTKPAERKLHVPVASDLCQASSDLLFSEAPVVSVEYTEEIDESGTVRAAPANVTSTRERLDLIAGPEFHKALASGAETSAALGGVYLRATWDTSIQDHPFVTVVDYDSAIPTFKWGRLTAVTFWRVTRTEGQQVWRHLEHHEVDTFGVGVIYHGLYQGTGSNLGNVVPLADDPSTEDIMVDADSKVSTMSPGLDVFHWENVAPNRLWRTDPLGKHFGRSDLDGLEPLLDGLDEAYTSLMRDVRLGKAMLIAPEYMLQNNGPGKGSTFEQNEVYSPVRVAPMDGATALPIEQVQFDIRVEALEQTIKVLWNQIIQSAGYSAQTFGEGTAAGAMTATEVFAKERRSGLTQGRKGRTVLPVLEALLVKLLAIDQAVLGSSADPSLPITVELADGVKDDPEALARTAQLLFAAQSASIDTRIRVVNPGKDEAWILAEVDRVVSENAIEPMADPDTVGMDGYNLSDTFGGSGDAGSA